jgi:hypothetical protein
MEEMRGCWVRAVGGSFKVWCRRLKVMVGRWRKLSEKSERKRKETRD